MYLIGIQNPTHRKKIKARASMYYPQYSRLFKENKHGVRALLNNMIIDAYRNHFYELKSGGSNQYLTAYPLNKILN